MADHVMLVSETIRETGKVIHNARKSGLTIGFVPTMGALHDGHLELVRRARKDCGLVACSIFVNPIQFNNPEDLEKYPRTVEEDLEMLRKEHCDLVFIPSVEEMYPEPVKKRYDFGELERVMEGKFRPGHFSGVAIVVRRLFDIIEPDRAYFGMKDYQQLRIIQELARMDGLKAEIVPCPTVREADGLAMSSRNRRLSAAARSLAPAIHDTLARVKEMYGSASPGDASKWAVERLTEKGFDVEYFEFSDAETLQPVGSWSEARSVIACVACSIEGIRLIDNMILFSNFATAIPGEQGLH